jgi:hypothetical protein
MDAVSLPKGCHLLEAPSPRNSQSIKGYVPKDHSNSPQCTTLRTVRFPSQQARKGLAENLVLANRAPGDDTRAF